MRCPACNKENPSAAKACEFCMSPLPNEANRFQATVPVSGMSVLDAGYEPGILIAGRYLVVRELGRGGMGVVYLVQDQQLRGKELALKLISAELTSNPQARERFVQEVLAAQDLTHSNLVKVFHLDEVNGQSFFTMEYLPGKSLRKVMEERQGKVFNLRECETVLLPVLAALEHAHTQTPPVVHRDIKPDNIIISGDPSSPQVKVLDFGLAKVLSPSKMTSTALSMGTAYYMAPEQLQGAKDVGFRADLFSVGVVLYEMLTGQVPSGRFELPSELDPALPAAIDAVVDRALKQFPGNRYASAGEMAEALRKVSMPSVQPLTATPLDPKVTDEIDTGVDVEFGSSPAPASFESANARRKGGDDPEVGASSRRTAGPGLDAEAKKQRFNDQPARKPSLIIGIIILMFVVLAGWYFLTVRDTPESLSSQEPTHPQETEGMQNNQHEVASLTSKNSNSVSIFQDDTFVRKIVAYYPLDGSGDDASSRGREAKIVNARKSMDRHGNADGSIFFDGNSAYLEIQPFKFSRNFTLAFWMKSEVENYPSNGKATFFIKSLDHAPWNDISFSDQGGNRADEFGVSVRKFNGRHNEILLQHGDVNDAQWHHWAVVLSGSSLRLYKDARLFGEVKGDSSWNDDVSAPLYFMRHWNRAAFARGSLDDIVILDDAISEADLRKLYAENGGMSSGKAPLTSPQTPSASIQPTPRQGGASAPATSSSKSVLGSWVTSKGIELQVRPNGEILEINPGGAQYPGTWKALTASRIQLFFHGGSQEGYLEVGADGVSGKYSPNDLHTPVAVRSKADVANRAVDLVDSSAVGSWITSRGIMLQIRSGGELLELNPGGARYPGTWEKATSSRIRLFFHGGAQEGYLEIKPGGSSGLYTPDKRHSPVAVTLR